MSHINKKQNGRASLGYREEWGLAIPRRQEVAKEGANDKGDQITEEARRGPRGEIARIMHGKDLWTRKKDPEAGRFPSVEIAVEPWEEQKDYVNDPLNKVVMPEEQGAKKAQE